MREDFKNKVYIVTGAAGGIGKATAERLLGMGASVVAVDIALIDLPGAYVLQADVTSAGDWDRIVATAEQQFDRLDGLFNNAGIIGVGAICHETREEDFDRVIDIDLKSVWLGMRAVQPLLARGGGAIVNTASIGALVATPRLIAYGASKAAVANMTQTAAVEYARFGIRVNAVCPGPTDTDMVRQAEMIRGPNNAEEGRKIVLSIIPMRRYGRAEEVASVVTFLLSNDASYVTGIAIPIDGGATAL